MTLPGADPTCPRCKGDGYTVIRDGEYVSTRTCGCVGTCPECSGAGWVASDATATRSLRRPCTCRRVRARLARLQETRIPGRHAGSTIKSFAPYERPLIKVRKQVEEVLTDWRPTEDNRGLVLYGDVGRGKTHLLCAILRDLVLVHGVSARFVEFSHLLADIKTGFDRGEGGGKLIDELVSVDVLGIDELGKGRNTEFEGTVLDELVSRRYNAARPIFATTNYAPVPSTGRATPNLAVAQADVALVDRVGARVFSRLRETTDFLEVPGVDFRQRDANAAANPTPGRTPRRGVE